MPRNASGVYQLPAGVTAVSGTVILPAQHNDAINDLGTETTASLPRDGRAGMTGDLPLFQNATQPLHAVPKQQLDAAVAGILSGAIAFPGDITPALITADQNNYNPPNLATAVVLRLSTDALRAVTGLAGGADGRIVKAINIGSNPILFPNESSSSDAGNRFAFDRNLTLYPSHSISFWYDATASRWRPVAVTSIVGKHTVNLLAAGMMSRTTNGPTAFSTELPTNDVMIKGFEFSATVEQAIQIRFPLPKGFNATPGLVFKFYWTTAATAGTGDVIWGVRARYVRNDDANDGAYGTAQTVIDTFLADDDMHITGETSAVTPGGTFAAECMLAVELYRDADAGGDTYSQPAVLEACMMHYTTSANTDD